MSKDVDPQFRHNSGNLDIGCLMLLGVFGVTLILPMMLLVGTVGLSRLHDSFVLHRYAAPFYDYPLPPNTVEISRDTRMAYGGSSGCNFYVERIVETSLSEMQLEDYFEDVRFPTPHRGDMEGAWVKIAKDGRYFRLTLSEHTMYLHHDLQIGCY